MSIEKVARNLFTANVYGPQGTRETQSVGSAFASESTEARGTTVQKADAVALSEHVKEVEKVRESLSGVPDVREDRVLALKQAIDSGSYVVSADKIADRLLNLDKGR
jgi:negative regulator of flagellin synthesis FlgM